MSNLPLKLRALLNRWWSSFSFVGLAFATLFFAASLTPTLLPRHYAVQGILSGLALAVGYGLGVLLVWLWIYMEIPQPANRTEVYSKRVTSVVVALVAIWFLWRATVWQNSIRQLMAMEPVETAYPWRVALIALLAGILLIAFARLIALFWRFVNRKLCLVLPRRVSYCVSTFVVGFVLLFVFNDVLAKLALDAADAVFVRIDNAVDDGIEQPQDALASGSPESLIEWDTIGRQGKNFIAGGPTQQSIGNFWDEDVGDKDVLQPLRVYVGLGSRETTEERATLALEELKRIGGFERSLLIVATPTGTGWLDPGGVDTIEYLHGGDAATVSMQYSYLPSWITILVDPHRSRDSARYLFDAIYDHWKTLPADSRPQLYLHGLSLGSLGSESSADLFTVFEDPIQGGVWSGPPFPSTVWSGITRYRNADSPMWLPTYRDGSMVRFTRQQNTLEQHGERWGPMRFVYIQYASDPMVFFSPELAWRSPEWLEGERGPDVSPYLRWYPIVTFLQTAFDLPMATAIPIGYGHNYAPANYIDAWIEVTDPADWSEEKTERLKAMFRRETP